MISCGLGYGLGGGHHSGGLRRGVLLPVEAMGGCRQLSGDEGGGRAVAVCVRVRVQGAAPSCAFRVLCVGAQAHKLAGHEDGAEREVPHITPWLSFAQHEPFVRCVGRHRRRGMCCGCAQSLSHG